jgi:hypothetical protein
VLVEECVELLQEFRVDHGRRQQHLAVACLAKALRRSQSAGSSSK